MRPVKSFICLLLLATYSTGQAQIKSWELGVGATSITLPFYPGSKQDKNYTLPFPYLKLKTDNLEIDDGIRGFLFKSKDLRLNISGDFGPPVDSEDSRLRRGMPDLDSVLQLGPVLEVILSGGQRQPHEFRLEFPIRTAIATDLKHTENIGWIFEPRVSYESLRHTKSGWDYEISTGLRFATKDYHRYYYDVDSRFETAQRPAFTTDGGYSGFFADFTTSWRDQDLVYWIYLRYQNLNNTEFEDSPLVEDNSYFAAGIGMVWIFASSF